MTATIASIIPPDFAQRVHLGEYLDWPVERYIEHWERISAEGGRIPQLFARVLQLALQHSSDTAAENSLVAESDADSEPEQSVPEGMYEIDICDLLYYFSGKSDSIAVNRLRSGGVTTVGELMSRTYSQLKLIPYIGTSTLQRALTYKRWLAMAHERLLQEYLETTREISLPKDYTGTESIQGALQTAIIEAAGLLRARSSNPRYIHSPREASSMKFLSKVLLLKYVEHLTFAEIAKELGKTPWHITKTHADFVTHLCDGKTVASNAHLDPGLMARVADLRTEKLFGRADVLGHTTTEDATLLSTVGVALLPVADGINILISSGEKCHFGAKARAVMRLLREKVVPVDEREFMECIHKTPEFTKYPDEKDDRFVKALLHDPDLMRHDSRGVMISMRHLMSDEQRVARIIYDEGTWMTRGEIFARFEERLGRASNSVNLSNLRKYGIHSSGDLWTYGKQLPPVNHFIADYARDNRIFYMADLEKELTALGYPILSRIRPYITQHCLVDNLDANHFCHKDYVTDYPEYHWRRPGRSGLSNWILICVKDICGNGTPVPYEEVVDRISERAQRESMEKYIRQRVKTTLTSYSGPGKPFLVENGMVTINPEVFYTVNFATIGRRGHHKTSQFEQIRQFAVHAVSSIEEGRMPLVVFIRQLNETCLPEATRNTCMRALTNRHLDPIPVEIDNIDGAIYLQYKG